MGEDHRAARSRRLARHLPRTASVLRAGNDYEAIQAGLSLHESPATQCAYRKEAERRLLWAIVERSCALSSLTTDDAVVYRAFLRRPSPRPRWVGPPRPCSSPKWRPFANGLEAASGYPALNAAHSCHPPAARWR
uniref:hypothetical protein n=1 Tax=Paraburkholderia aspalathi TaxID=1324617 RepID=UPI0038BB0B80